MRNIPFSYIGTFTLTLVDDRFGDFPREDDVLVRGRFVLVFDGKIRYSHCGYEFFTNAGVQFYFAPRFIESIRTKWCELPWHSRPRVPGRVCRRCGGSGHLLRPAPKKLLNFNRCSSCGGKGITGMRKMEIITGTLEILLARMKAEGRAFGSHARTAIGRAQMPEAVALGTNHYSEAEIRTLLEYERLHMLGRLHTPRPFSWQQFLDRKQDEIDRRRWNES